MAQYHTVKGQTKKQTDLVSSSCKHQAISAGIHTLKTTTTTQSPRIQCSSRQYWGEITFPLRMSRFRIVCKWCHKTASGSYIFMQCTCLQRETILLKFSGLVLSIVKCIYLHRIIDNCQREGIIAHLVFNGLAPPPRHVVILVWIICFYCVKCRYCVIFLIYIIIIKF